MRRSHKEKIVINKNYTHIKEYLKKLPDIFRQTGKVIYKGRNTIKIFDLEGGLRINVKSFKTPHLLNQFIYSTFRKSKAKRSYLYAKALQDLGIDTPTPIAYMEFSKPLLLKKSLYVSEHVDIDGEMRVLQVGSLKEHRELIVAFAHFTAKLHDLNILHLDYSSGNILFKKEKTKYTFYLVDLNRMKFDKEITLKTASHNFRRLWGSNEMLALFTKEYAIARNFDVDMCLTNMFMYRTKFWTSFNKRHPEVKPYLNV